MIFKQNLLEKFDLRNIDAPFGRVYETPIGTLQSVTTVLNSFGNKKGLESWKEWIGHDKADQILLQAINRGEAVHKICENYLSNLDWRKGTMPVNLASFLRIKSILDSDVQEVLGLEYPLYSKLLQSAGRTDGIIKWDNYFSILDFKTSLKPIKLESEKVLKWKLQTTAYSMMVEELYGFDCENCIIVVMIDHEDPAVIIFENIHYRDQVMEIFCNRG